MLFIRLGADMKTRNLLLLLLSFCCSCQQVQKEKWPGKPADTITIKTDTGEKPDIHLLRQYLLDYFATHKRQDVFDTTDDTYREYWGPAEYAPYKVSAGHLFNKEQIHAVLSYCDAEGTGISVYLRDKGLWTKIFEDTSIAHSPGVPEYRDWNGDEIKDLCLYYPAPTASLSVIGSYALWLMDANGLKLHPVSDFKAIGNPQTSRVAGYVTSSYEYHGKKIKSKYRFHNYALVKLDRNR